MITFIDSNAEAGQENNDHHPEKETKPIDWIRKPDRKVLNSVSGRYLRWKNHETYQSHYSDTEK
jgi:hypothetical protein